MKILIVDDELTSRELLKAMLTPYGECHLSESGKEAIELFKRLDSQGERFDLICMDIMMPEMNGHETLREIRRIEAARQGEGSLNAKVIMTTALGDAQNIMDAVKSGDDAYIVKPVGKETLIKRMKELGLLEDAA
jgi:two-component system, chemotaxis family, chemotaxis protein CheY